MQLIVKPIIQSVSDIITNSSSETFLIDKNGNDDAKEFILSYGKEQLDNGNDDSSGMGGELSIYDYRDGFKNYKKLYKKDDSFTHEDFAKEVDVPLEELENTLIVDIDWKRKGTIEMINTLFKVICEVEDMTEEQEDKYYRCYNFWTDSSYDYDE